jgi:hypothetical protein
MPDKSSILGLPAGGFNPAAQQSPVAHKAEMRALENETMRGALGLPMGASGAMAGGAAGGNGNAIITIQNATITAVSTQATIGSMQADVSFAMINAQGGMGGGSGEAGSSPSGDQLGEGILGGLLSGSGGLASKLFRN